MSKHLCRRCNEPIKGGNYEGYEYGCRPCKCGRPVLTKRTIRVSRSSGNSGRRVWDCVCMQDLLSEEFEKIMTMAFRTHLDDIYSEEECIPELCQIAHFMNNPDIFEKEMDSVLAYYEKRIELLCALRTMIKGNFIKGD